MRAEVLKQLSRAYERNELLFGSQVVHIDPITRISAAQGMLLNQIASLPDIKKSLEIGFAYGFSTIYILEALLGKEGSTHVAIDPFEDSDWGGVGLKLVKQFGYNNFRWIKDYSIHELSKLIQKNSRFDLIYIDGNHRFDDVLTDFYLSDQVLNVGGYLVLDDMWMPSIQNVEKFIITNRAYGKVNQPVANAAVFQKLSNDSRDWDHFIEF